jgi:hypothetical protein
MRIRVIHLWIPAVISYGLTYFMALSKEHIEAIIFTVLYMSLLVCTKWAEE